MGNNTSDNRFLAARVQPALNNLPPFSPEKINLIELENIDRALSQNKAIKQHAREE